MFVYLSICCLSASLLLESRSALYGYPDGKQSRMYCQATRVSTFLAVSGQRERERGKEGGRKKKRLSEDLLCYFCTSVYSCYSLTMPASMCLYVCVYPFCSFASTCWITSCFGSAHISTTTFWRMPVAVATIALATVTASPALTTQEGG